jgi:hypothetical protein
MQRTDTNILRLRRGLSPPLQHQRKIGCFVDHRVRHDDQRTPDASVSARQLFLNLHLMMVKVAGQKSDDHEEHDTRISITININPMRKLACSS